MAQSKKLIYPAIKWWKSQFANCWFTRPVILIHFNSLLVLNLGLLDELLGQWDDEIDSDEMDEKSGSFPKIPYV